jgi:hypothetical protein
VTEIAGPGTWRVAWGPGQVDEDGAEWAVVFRVDGPGRDAEGPQIVVTGTAVTEYDSNDPEADVTYEVEYSYTTRFAFQVWAPNGDLIALASKQAPYSWHNRAVDIDDARDQAKRIVQECAEDPSYWATWDGTAGFSGVAEPDPHAPDWPDAPAGRSSRLASTQPDLHYGDGVRQLKTTLASRNDVSVGRENDE